MMSFKNKDQFNNNIPKNSPVDSKDLEKIIKILPFYFENFVLDFIKIIGNLIDLKKEFNSLNYIVCMENKKKYILKKIPKKITTYKRMVQITNLMHWLEKSEIKIPKIYFTKNDTFFIEDKENFWLLMEFIDGNYFSGDLYEIQEIATSSGKLLNILSNLPIELKPSKHKEAYFTKKENQILFNLNNSQLMWDKIFGEEFASKLSKNLNYINDQWKNINNHTYINKKYNSIIHHDLHPHNFIFSKNKAYILDYDSIIIGPIESAIGFSSIKIFKYVYDKNIDEKNLLFMNNEWISSVYKNLTFSPNFKKIELFGRAEVFRRFLSMVNKAILDIPSTFNGPEVHLDSLFLADKIFVK